MDMGEYRQVTGGVGIALFVSGMAIWPTGLVARPMNWILWGVGVGTGLLGIYVFTAAIVPSSAWMLPGKTEALARIRTRNQAHNLLAMLRMRGMRIERDPKPDDIDEWSLDVLDFVSKAWDAKHMTLFAPIPGNGDLNSPAGLRNFVTTLDQFIARCDLLELDSEFRIEPERWKKYLDD